MKKIALYAAKFSKGNGTLYPLSLGYLAAFLIEQKYPVDIRIVESFEELERFQPEIVGVSSVSQVMSDAVSFAKRCKEQYNAITILGGYHITLAPETLPEEFDYGVIGEGELTFSELVEILISDRSNYAAIKNVAGLCFKSGSSVYLTPKRKYIENLDSLPFPLRDFFSDEAPIFTSRGCPFSCLYCAAPAFWNSCYRMRSASAVVEEIEQVITAKLPREIVIVDDLWMADKVRFREIVDRLEASGATREVTFRGFCRSNLIEEQDIALLQKMNYRIVRFGAETGSERLLKRIKGSSASIYHHQKTINLCDKHNMPCSASFMFGLPGETREDLEATRIFLRKNRKKLSISGFYFFNPIPGTEMWNELVRNAQIERTFSLETMQLDILNQNFIWRKDHYFNEENIPFSEFRQIVGEIRAEFIS